MRNFIRSSRFPLLVAIVSGGLALALPQHRDFLMWFFILGVCYWLFEFVGELRAKG